MQLIRMPYVPRYLQIWGTHHEVVRVEAVVRKGKLLGVIHSELELVQAFGLHVVSILDNGPQLQLVQIRVPVLESFVHCTLRLSVLAAVPGAMVGEPDVCAKLLVHSNVDQDLGQGANAGVLQLGAGHWLRLSVLPDACEVADELGRVYSESIKPPLLLPKIRVPGRSLITLGLHEVLVAPRLRLEEAHLLVEVGVGGGSAAEDLLGSGLQAIDARQQHCHGHPRNSTLQHNLPHGTRTLQQRMSVTGAGLCARAVSARLCCNMCLRACGGAVTCNHEATAAMQRRCSTRKLLQQTMQ